MNTTRAQQIAEAVRIGRRSKGLTQAQLAEACAPYMDRAPHTQTIGNLERASHASSSELLNAVSKVLDINLGAGALVARHTTDVVWHSMLGRIDKLDEAEALLFAGEVLRFVTEWSPHGGMKS